MRDFCLCNEKTIDKLPREYYNNVAVKATDTALVRKCNIEMQRSGATRRASAPISAVVAPL